MRGSAGAAGAAAWLPRRVGGGWETTGCQTRLPLMEPRAWMPGAKPLRRLRRRSSPAWTGICWAVRVAWLVEGPEPARSALMARWPEPTAVSQAS